MHNKQATKEELVHSVVLIPMVCDDAELLRS